jgi:general nucleoside transport system permease protein
MNPLGQAWTRARWRSSLLATALFAGAVGIALVASAVLVEFTHGQPGSVFTAMYDGSVNGWGSLGYTLDNAAPLLIVALGAIISVRAGQFNIGQEGQLMMGALAGALVAIRVPGPGPLVLILALCAATLGGAAWAAIAALLRYWRGVDIVISSLLLIFVAGQLLSYAVNNEWFIQEHGTTTGRLAESAPIPAGVHLPHLGHYPSANAGAGFLLAIGLALTVSALLARSRWGFRLKILGLNPVAARRAGINAALIGGAAIVISGAFAGLAGGVVLTSTAYRLTPTISNNIGWSGLLVALVARNNASAAVATALLFGAAEAGGSFLSTAGIATDLVPIVQALVVLGVVLPPALLHLRASRRGAIAVQAAA